MSDRDYIHHFRGARHRSVHQRAGGQPHDPLAVYIAGCGGERAARRVPRHGAGHGPANGVPRPLRIDQPAGQASFMLLRRDGTVLVRYPDPTERAGERMPQDSAWYTAGGARRRQLQIVRLFRRERLVAVRPLPDYPLVMDVGLTKHAALARWRGRRRLIGSARWRVRLPVAAAARVGTNSSGCRRSRRALTARNADLTRTAARLQAASGELEITLASMDQGLMMVDAGAWWRCASPARDRDARTAGRADGARPRSPRSPRDRRPRRPTPSGAALAQSARLGRPASTPDGAVSRCAACRCRAAASSRPSTTSPRAGTPSSRSPSWRGTTR